MLVLQQVNQVAKPALIAPIGGGLNVGLFKATAQAAANFAAFPGVCVGRNEALAANRALTAGNRPHCIQARCANWKTRNVQERITADPAIGRKQGSEEALGDFARSRNNRRPRGYFAELRSPSSVPTTAEDGLPSPGGCIWAPARRIFLSIAVPLKSRNALSLRVFSRRFPLRYLALCQQRRRQHVFAIKIQWFRSWRKRYTQRTIGTAIAVSAARSPEEK